MAPPACHCLAEETVFQVRMLQETCTTDAWQFQMLKSLLGKTAVKDKGHCLHWWIPEVSGCWYQPYAPLWAGVHELCLAPGWAGLRELLSGDTGWHGHRGASDPWWEVSCWFVAPRWLPISLQMHTGMQNHVASNMPSALLQYIKVWCALSINLSLLVLSLFSSL